MCLTRQLKSAGYPPKQAGNRAAKIRMHWPVNQTSNYRLRHVPFEPRRKRGSYPLSHLYGYFGSYV